MSFGRNPHVAKAEAAEQKARTAKDGPACEQAWRDAARQWERAADRETDDKRRDQYTAKAEAARTSADEPRVENTENLEKIEKLRAPDLHALPKVERDPKTSLH